MDDNQDREKTEALAASVRDTMITQMETRGGVRLEAKPADFSGAHPFVAGNMHTAANPAVVGNIVPLNGVPRVSIAVPPQPGTYALGPDGRITITDDRMTSLYAGYSMPVNSASSFSVSAGWDQKRINDWQARIFGLADADAFAIWDKLQGEMAELFTELRQRVMSSENRDKFAKEVADVYIVLCQLAGRYGVNIQEHVDAKMAINEARKWNVSADGVGQHVPE